MAQEPKDNSQKKEQGRQNPALSHVIKQNIRTIVRHKEENVKKRSLQERISDKITDFSGSMSFVYVHIIWFGLWIILNTGWFGFKPFDPFPYGLLTMVVSLEAIFLSTFVLISQNRMSKDDEERNELDLQINLLTEQELTRVLQMLDKIQQKLGVEPGYDRELSELEMETKPEEVLKEIHRHEKPKGQ